MTPYTLGKSVLSVTVVFFQTVICQVFSFQLHNAATPSLRKYSIDYYSSLVIYLFFPALEHHRYLSLLYYYRSFSCLPCVLFSLLSPNQRISLPSYFYILFCFPGHSFQTHSTSEGHALRPGIMSFFAINRLLHSSFVTLRFIVTRTLKRRPFSTLLNMSLSSSHIAHPSALASLEAFLWHTIPFTVYYIFQNQLCFTFLFSFFLLCELIIRNVFKCFVRVVLFWKLNSTNYFI